MEATQDGIHFLLSVVRIERKRVYDEIQNDQQFASPLRDLLERTIRVEIILQDFPDVFWLFIFRLVSSAFAFELSTRQGLDCLFIQVIEPTRFSDDAGSF